jgi:signal transduction histidine kinase
MIWAFGKGSTASGVIHRVEEIVTALDRTTRLPALATALAIPDQPVILLNQHGHVLASRVTLALDRGRAHPLAPAVLRALLHATVQGRGLLTPWSGTVETPDGSYIVLVQPATWSVLGPLQVRVVSLGLHGLVTPKSDPAAQALVRVMKGDRRAVGDPATATALAPLHPTPLVVLIARRLDETQQTVDTVTEIMLGGALVVIALPTVLSLLLVGRALRPLTTITRGAERLAQGDFNHRLALSADADEVGRLAAAFDRMAAAIASSFATQRRFVADASHELRTPLTALRTYADVLLLEGQEVGGTVERAARAMQDLLGRMSRLVDDLLTLARLDTGVALRLEPVVLADLLTVATQEGQALARAGQEVVVDATPEGMMAWGDRDRLRQVLSNLIGNACAYSPEGSTIRLRATPEAFWAVIAVQDSGPGVAPADLARLGERFYRGDAARSRRTGGTGLGLAIARAIVEAHGGRLTIESVLGQGTTVTLRLPLGPVLSSRG